MNWLDWLFISILIISGWQGLKKGFIHSISGLLGIIMGLAAALTGYKALSNYLYHQLNWGSSVSALILERIPMPVIEQLDQIGSVWDLLLIPFTGQEQGESLFYNTPVNIHIMVSHISASLIDLIALMMLFLGTYIIVKLLIIFLSYMTDKTLFSPIDRAGGLLVGLAKGVLIVLVLVILARPMIQTGDAVTGSRPGLIYNGIAGSKVIPYANEFLKTFNISIPVRPLQNSDLKQI